VKVFAFFLETTENSLVAPDILTVQLLAAEFMKVKNELDKKSNVSKDSSQALKDAAMHLRCEIKKLRLTSLGHHSQFIQL
jgi:hypothetical protein